MLHTKDPEHWVPLETVASFKRMRDYKPHGLPWLVSTLRSHSTDLEVDESGTKVRRTTEVQEPKGQFERSIYAVCFPHSLLLSFFVYRNYPERFSRRRCNAAIEIGKLLFQIRQDERCTHET